MASRNRGLLHLIPYPKQVEVEAKLEAFVVAANDALTTLRLEIYGLEIFLDDLFHGESQEDDPMGI